MKSFTHTIDPEGDLIVVLKEPNTQEVVPEVSLRPSEGPVNRDFKLDDTVVNLPALACRIPTDGAPPDQTEIRFRVSTRHLILASVTFKKMLSGPWKESNPDDSQSASGAANSLSTILKSGSEAVRGLILKSSPDATSSDVHTSTDTPHNVSSRVDSATSSTPASTPIREVSATGWSAEALFAVFNIIHGQSSEVPRIINLKFFAEVAVIANYYECAKALSFAAEVWFNSCATVPTQYGKKAIMWLFIAWEFSWPNLFASMARMVVEGGQGLKHVETHDLPIGPMLETLNCRRDRALHPLLRELTVMDRKLRDDQDGSIGCNHQCKSMMLGSLVREKTSHCDLVNKEPLYNGVSLIRTINAINAFRPIEWWNGPSRVTAHQCSPKKLMEPLIKTVREDINSLKLSDFQK